MLSPYLLLHRLVGLLLVLLGLFVLAGWLWSDEVMIRIIPNSPAMAINTASMLLIGGMCLLVAGGQAGGQRLYLAGSIVLMVLPAVILSQTLLNIDLGVDLASVHARVGDGHANPGRTAPNACLAFFASGLLFFLHRRDADSPRVRRASYLLAALPLAVGGLAVLGYMVNLEAMYTIASYNRMAMLTGLGIFTLGIGLAGFVGHRMARDDRSPRDSVKQITRLSAVLLTSFAIVAGLTGFAVLRQGFELSSRENLQSSAKTDAFIVSSELDQAILLTRAAARRALLRQYLTQVAAGISPESLHQELEGAAASLLDLGFSSIDIYDGAGNLLVTAGQPAAHRAEVSLPVDASPGVALQWQDGYILSGVQEVLHGGKTIGSIRTESQLRGITAFLAEAQSLHRTVEVMLCGRSGNEAVCLPNAWQGRVLRYPLTGLDGRAPGPIARSVLGETGAAESKNERGALLQSGFAPVPSYSGLGLVINKPVSELYAPLRDRLNLLTIALAGFVAVGTLLLRHWVQPLVEQIVSEQRRFRSILNNSSDAFIAVGSNGLISDWNRQSEKLLGFSAADAIGRDLTELIVPLDQREAHRTGFARFLVTGAGPIINRRIEVMAMHKSGAEIPVELSVAAYRTGETYGSSAFLRDLSERREAERKAAEYAKELEAAREALVQSQKLEAVGKLTGGVAHDFNNVLQVVRGSLQLLQIENTDNGTVTNRIKTAMTAVDRGAKLSSQLLAFARKQPLQPQTVNLASMMRGMGEMLQRAIGDAIEVQVRITEELWNSFADPNQLENVILNLVINARDAMQGQGRLTIEVGNANLDEEYVASEPGLSAGEYVFIAVSDTGPGMAEEVRARAFEPFFTTKPEGEGTGLGLSMAHGFVKQSGGQIRLDSALGAGTTVRIYLPRSHGEEKAPKRRWTTPADGGAETILVVEDDKAVQATVVDMLKGLGYSVLRADNAEVALEIIQRHPHLDLLFTDVIMPGSLRSPELARRAKQLLPDLQVLFTSGYTQDAIVHDGRLDPDVHLLSKPYGREELARKLRELLDEPAATAAAENIETAAVGETTAPASIAVVEDDESFRAVVCEMITLLGYQVSSFGNAESALAAFEREAFDILLTDITLPGGSGLALADAVRRARPSTHIILASGHGDSLGSEEALGYAILAKPFSMEQLSARLGPKPTSLT